MGAFDFIKQIADAGTDAINTTDTLGEDTNLFDSVIK